MAAPVIVGILILGGVGYAAYRKWKGAKAAPGQQVPIGAPDVKGAPAPAILVLRDAIDARWPRRGKWSDGIMGDTAHQARVSDHNQGNAVDVTVDPLAGPDMDELADAIFRDERVTYEIYKNRIRSKTIAPGQWRPYCDGKASCNPHTRHMHISIDAAKRGDTRPWDLAGVGNAKAEAVA